MKIKVLIIGLGNIGMGYDLNLEPKKFSLTHARAFSYHKNFKIIGGVDIDKSKKYIFEKEFSAPFYDSLEIAVNEKKPDLIIVSTPTKFHHETVINIVQVCSPKMILCEKPLSYSSKEAEDILSICKKNKINLFVNYYKRSDQSNKEITSLISNEYKNTQIKGTVWYSKGLIHNGLHFLDLLISWLGPYKKIDIINFNQIIDDYDFNPDFLVKFEYASIIFVSTNKYSSTHHNIELFFKNGKLEYKGGGIEINWNDSIKDKFSDKYYSISNNKRIIKNRFNYSQYNVAEEVYKYFKSGIGDNLCSGDQAYNLIKAGLELMERNK